MRIDHININSSADSIERVKDFYCEVFELKTGYRPDFSSPGYWLYADGAPLIHLSSGDPARKPAPTGCLDHIAFRVSELEPVISRLAARGVKFDSAVADAGLRQIFFTDPAGVKIEVNCRD